MNDDQAERVAELVLELACAMRDDLDEVTELARDVLAAAGDDPVAAVAVAACLIDVDAPLRIWWQEGLAGIGTDGDRRMAIYPLPPSQQLALTPCGTRVAYVRHVRNSEPIDRACRAAQRRYDAERRLHAGQTPRPVSLVKKQPRRLAPCGTHAAFVRHKYRGEPIDDLCRDGNRIYQRDRKRAGRARSNAA